MTLSKKILVYGVIPVSLSLALIAAYFSGIDWLQQLVSPKIPNMLPDSRREFGLLENLQNAFLMATLITAAIGVKRKPLKAEKVAMALLAAGFLFLLLEEIDYGLHYYELIRGVPWYEAAKTRNIHNVAETTDVMKRTCDVFLALWFVVVPLAFAESRRPLLRYLAPDRFFIITIVAMVLLSTLAHGLKDAGFGGQGTISKNLSEFRELQIYYVFMLYLMDLVFRRRLPDEPPKEA